MERYENGQPQGMGNHRGWATTGDGQPQGMGNHRGWATTGGCPYGKFDTG